MIPRALVFLLLLVPATDSLASEEIGGYTHKNITEGREQKLFLQNLHLSLLQESTAQYVLGTSSLGKISFSMVTKWSLLDERYIAMENLKDFIDSVAFRVSLGNSSLFLGPKLGPKRVGGRVKFEIRW